MGGRECRTAISRKVIQAEHDARLDDWSVPMRLGGRSLQVKGHVEYRPVLGATASKVTSGASPLPGVQVNYLPGRVPGFFLVNTGSRPVTVLGGRGEPFARIGPRGVEVNTLSPTHAYDQMARGTRPRTVPDPAAVPRWRRVSAQNSFTWLDGRPIYPHQAPADVVRDHRAAVLKRWSIPLRSDGRRASVRGATTWSPLTTAAATGSGGAGGVGGGLALAIGGFLLFVAAMAGAVRARRRRPRDGRALERAG